MKHSWGFILLGITLLGAGWIALYTIIDVVDTRVTSSKTQFAIQLKDMDVSHHREFALIRSEAKEIRNDIRYIRNNISLRGTVSMERP